MKNPSKHGDDLRQLYKRLVKEYKPEPRQPQEPLKALVRGAMSFDLPDDRAEEALRAIDREFVDLNELRVATELEARDLLGSRFPGIERRVAMLTAALNNIFEREHTLSLDRLREVSKRDARQFLRELPDIHPFVEAYVMLFAFDGHTFPADDATLALFRENRVIDDSVGLEECQRFVEHHLKAEECYELFAAVRQVAFDEDGKGRRKK